MKEEVQIVGTETESNERRAQILLEQLDKLSRDSNTSTEYYQILLLEYQSLEDFNKFKKLEKDLPSLLKGLSLEEQAIVEARMNSLKLWWMKQNKQLLESGAHMEDRDLKRDAVTELRSIPLHQLQAIMRNAARLEHNEVKNET